MSIQLINGSLDPKKQPNFYDGQQLNVDDMEQLQIYLDSKIETGIHDVGFDGVVEVKGLQVNPDSVMAEPFPFPTVPQSGANPDLQNFRDFPEDPLDTQEVKIYQVFQAETNNLQRFDLKTELLVGLGNSVLFVELVELTVPTNPLSDLSSNSLFIKQFSESDIPSPSSDEPLVVDVSFQNNGQGISLVVGNFYAILIRFLRETGSQDQIRVFHSNVAQTAAVSSNYYAHFFVNGHYQQGLYNSSAQLVNMVLYNKVYTSAVRVEPGSAYYKGQHILVETPQRFFGLLDRRDITDQTGERLNYVAIKYVLLPTDPELHPRTSNKVDSRYEDSFEIQVFNQFGWNAELAKGSDREWFLLAVVVDRNIVPFRQRFEFILNQRINLAYNDWLNPCITTPSLPALQIKAARPDDFVFFVDNIPAEMPLIDDAGNPTFDELGRLQVDTVAHVYLILYLDGGTNTRRFEMALNNSTTTTPPFNSYFITMTNPGGSSPVGLANFVFDIKELMPNTFYNFVAITSRGRSIFLQDYNIQVRTPDPNTGLLELSRSRTYSVRLNEGSLDAVIDEDLRLADPVAPFGNVGQRVTGFHSEQQVDEVPGRNGVTASQTINPITDSLVEVPSDLPNSFKFEPLPMCFRSGAPIQDASPAVMASNVISAVAASDIVIRVNGVPITFSGTEGPERGGVGAPHTVSGAIIFSDDAGERLTQMQDLAISLGFTPPADANDYQHFSGMRVTVRDAQGRDCSQQSVVAITQMDGGRLVYRIIAMGRGTGNPAGFVTGQGGYLYFENRLARDVVGVPLQFIYTPFGASILDVRQIDTLLSGQSPVVLGTGEQWFGERDIVYAPDLATFRARATAYKEIGIDPVAGQVFWNAHDQNLIFDIPHSPLWTAAIDYFQLDQKYAVINFYFTRHTPWGCPLNCPIANEDVAIQNAITQGFVSIKVNGSSIYTPPLPYVGPPIDLSVASLYVAMHPGLPLNEEYLLPADKISLDPNLGKIVFGTDIRPSPGDDVTITYYFLRPLTTCVSNALGVVYDPRYDFNLDGRVDETDLNQFMTAYGSHTGDPNYSTLYDFNNDGVVDGNDFQDFLDHFGTVTSGLPTFHDATEARLNSILVYQKDNPLRRFRVIRAVSEGPTVEYPLGRSVLFFDTNTPILETGDYTILFGFAAALITGINNVTITTSVPITSQVNKDIIEVFREDDPTDTRKVIDVVSTSRVDNNITVFDNLISFTPSITASGNFIFQALWSGGGLAVVNRSIYIETVAYEHNCRRNLGPFKMAYVGGDFASDGSSIIIRFDTSESTMADGTMDPSGLHLDGVPITGMRFAILLLVPMDNNIMGVWKWYHFAPTQSDQGIKLEFNQFLGLDCRYVGKNGVPVLQPFGTAANQVDLRPKYAGGDVENNLSNIVVIRDDQLPNYSLPHNHMSDDEGGILTSQNVSFADPEARFNTGDVTDVIYQLQDALQQQLNGLLAQMGNLQIDASQVIVNDTHGHFGAPSGRLTLQDAIDRIIDFIAWDELS